MFGSGFLPPVADGFSKFIKANNVARALAEYLQKQMENGKADSYDTNPLLKKLIDEVNSVQRNEFASENQLPVISLVENNHEFEKQLLTFITDKKNVDALKPID